MSAELPVIRRLWLAWVCFFRVLLSGDFAREVQELAEGRAPAAPRADPTALPTPPAVTPEPPPPPPLDAALQLLALLQREGRLVDFLQQDITAFGDADVGMAARVVHAGCQKALRAHASLAPLRGEEEGARVTVSVGFAPDEIKLSGNVQGSPPYTGTLRHRGWRATDVHLPTAVRAHDVSVLAPAEVEL